MVPKKKAVITLAVSGAALLLFAVAILPHIVKKKAVSAITAATGRQTRIGSVAINPFTLTVTVADFSVEEKGKSPLLTIDRLRASLSTASLYRRALILDELAVDQPKISFTRTGANRYSFSDIIDRHAGTSPGKESGGLLFSLNNITITNGSLDFNDLAVGAGKSHTVRNLNVGIPFISNIPYYADSYTAPRVSATVNGTHFDLDGKTKPLSKSRETSLHLGLDRLNLSQYMDYSPVVPPAVLKSGFLTVDAEVSYRISSDKKPELNLSGTVKLDDTAILLRDGRPLLTLPHLAVKASKLELSAKRYAVDSVLLDGLEVFLARNKGGEWMYASLLPQRKEAGTGTAPDEGESPQPGQTRLPLVTLSDFVLKNGTVHFADGVPEGGFTARASAIEGTVKGFSTAEGASAEYGLSLSMDGKSTVSSAGRFSPDPGSVSGNLTLAGLDLYRTWPYLAPWITAPVQGRLDLSAGIAHSKEEGFSVENGLLHVSSLSTRYGSKDRFTLAELTAGGISYRQKSNQLEIADIGLAKGACSVSREMDGTLSVLSLLREKEGKHPAPRGTAPAAARLTAVTTGKKASPLPPFSYRVKSVQASGLNLAFTDKTREGDPVFTLNNTKFSLSEVKGPRFSPAAVRFFSIYGKDSRLEAAGILLPSPFSYTGTIKIGRLPLPDFEPYLPENLNVLIVDGLFNADMKVNLAMKDGKPSGTFQGNAGVHSFYSMDALEEQDLLKWENLQFDGIQGALAPFALNIRQVALDNVYSRIIVRKDGTLNLQGLVDRAPDGRTAETKAAAVSPANAQGMPAASPPPRPKVEIADVTIQEGTIAFSDQHLPQPFSTTFHNLGGRVSRLSSEELKFADVDLRGNLENRSPLQITGRINPLREDLLVDLKISFKDIELPGISPYSGTYLGYAVDQGKLSLDLKYLIEKKQLNSENKVFIDQFTFGDRVESPKATSLPVRLAVAVLKDRKGEIHLDLPVTGRTDDPQFSLLGVVWQVVKNLFSKAATSPLALISSLAGGEADFSSIAFAPGSSRISPQEADKLRKLANALAERPGIRLEVIGFVDRGRDPEAYRHELLKKKMKTEKFLQMVKERRHTPGQSAESLEILPDEYSKVLKTVYEKEKFPKPRTIIGTLKSLPDSEMLKLILANTAIGDDQLRELARERCAAVSGFLVTDGKLSQERVFEKIGDLSGQPQREGASSPRVEFAVGLK